MSNGLRSWLPDDGKEFYGLDRAPRPLPPAPPPRRMPRWLDRLAYAVRFRISYGEWPITWPDE